MNSKFIFLGILPIALLNACSFSSPHKHIKCNDPNGIAILQDVLEKDLNQDIDRTLKDYIKKDVIDGLDPNKLKASAKQIQYSFVDSRTNFVDPNSTRSKCTIDVTITIPNDAITKASKVRSENNLGSLEDFALDLDLDYSGNKLKFPLAYTLQPNDGGDKIFATLQGTDKLVNFIADTLSVAFIKPNIDSGKASYNNSNYSAADAANAAAREAEAAAAADEYYYEDQY